MVFIIGSTVLVNIILIAFRILKNIKRLLLSLKCGKKVVIHEPLVEAKVVNNRYKLNKKKKGAAALQIIDESMYIDDGRY